MTQEPERPATLSRLVGRQIKVALVLKDMSGRDLAAQLGVSPSWVSYRLSGKQEIGIDDLHQIATVLGVDLSELLSPAVAAKANEDGKGVKRDFDHAPADAAVTIGQGSVGIAKRVTDVREPRKIPRPFSQPKPGPNRPVSAVPARKRRPCPFAPATGRQGDRSGRCPPTPQPATLDPWTTPAPATCS
jgi:transcriptional regulator with XRE-family HTH domain